MSDWSWKDSGGGCGKLLYEPGNWGDILKGGWLVRCLDFHSSIHDGFSYLDVFAGLPEYPLSMSTLRRIRRIDDHRLLEVAGDYLDKTVWPSAALLAHGILDSTAPVRVYDREDIKRQAYGELDGIEVLSGSDGWKVLQEKSGLKNSFILIDPYDFLADWKDNIQLLFTLAENNSVLLYLYNRSGKSRETLRKYRDFRNELERGGLSVLTGRAAADGFVPDSWHEMYFFPVENDPDKSGYAQLRLQLRQLTEKLADIISRSAVFEEYG